MKELCKGIPFSAGFGKSSHLSLTFSASLLHKKLFLRPRVIKSFKEMLLFAGCLSPRGASEQK